MVKIELVYVPQNGSVVQLKMNLAQGATVAQALIQSGIYHLYPETKEFVVGIYARPVSLSTLLREGDRVEIYRPLLSDPKEKRRQRARK